MFTSLKYFQKANVEDENLVFQHLQKKNSQNVDLNSGHLQHQQVQGQDVSFEQYYQNLESQNNRVQSQVSQELQRKKIIQPIMMSKICDIVFGAKCSFDRQLYKSSAMRNSQDLIGRFIDNINDELKVKQAQEILGLNPNPKTPYMKNINSYQMVGKGVNNVLKFIINQMTLTQISHDRRMPSDPVYKQLKDQRESFKNLFFEYSVLKKCSVEKRLIKNLFNTEITDVKYLNAWVHAYMLKFVIQPLQKLRKDRQLQNDDDSSSSVNQIARRRLSINKIPDFAQDIKTKRQKAQNDERYDKEIKQELKEKQLQDERALIQGKIKNALHQRFKILKKFLSSEQYDKLKNIGDFNYEAIIEVIYILNKNNKSRI
eukprot:403360273